eukprot:Amastigsp_a841351_819.p3 type:complete len:103 gc:universal Amastigsp_a841351_819:883-575(-)
MGCSLHVVVSASCGVVCPRELMADDCRGGVRRGRGVQPLDASCHPRDVAQSPFQDHHGEPALCALRQRAHASALGDHLQALPPGAPQVPRLRLDRCRRALEL